MINAYDFVEMFGNKEEKEIIELAKVDSNYTGGRPKLVFDGETTASIKAYPYLSSYTPAANDRVMVIKGVVVGSIV